MRLLAQTEPLRDAHEIGHRFDAHFLHHAPAMDFDRCLGSAELRSNLFIEHAGNYAFEHVKLAWCERCQSITHLLALQALEPLLRRPLESALDGTQEIFVVVNDVDERVSKRHTPISVDAGSRNQNWAPLPSAFSA